MQPAGAGGDGQRVELSLRVAASDLPLCEAVERPAVDVGQQAAALEQGDDDLGAGVAA